MTTIRQLGANRRNALKGTGPRTDNGKNASRQNALRHGLTAETVIEPFEDPEEYRMFEAAIVSEYLPQTPVEHELVHRLASLFWRLRRAGSIETGLLRMQAEILHYFRISRENTKDGLRRFAGAGPEFSHDPLADAKCAHELHAENGRGSGASPSRAIAVSFLRLANLDNELIDRLSRYEAGLWRQLVQTLFALQTLKRR
jgi:hypothetical protein